MNKCALDCTPPLRFLQPGREPGRIDDRDRISVHDIAAYHAQRGDTADFIIMLPSCCFSKHPGCHDMKEILQRDHERLLRDGRRVAPLFQYTDLVRRPLATSRALLAFAPYLGSLDANRPRLAVAGKLGSRPFAVTEKQDSIFEYLSRHNFEHAPTSRRAPPMTQAATSKRAHDGPPYRGNVAVCIMGLWRSLARTAPSIRSFVLEPLDADAYGVIQANEGANGSTTRTASDCEGLVGPRIAGRCVVGTFPSLRTSVYNKTALAHLLHVDGAGARCQRLQSSTANNQMHVWLQQDACLGLVRRVEQRGGFSYAAYMRTRTDVLFFRPPVPALAQEFLWTSAADDHVALVPSGDAWGQYGEGVCDNILIAGRRAFEVDAKAWHHTANISSPMCHRHWISEGFLRQALDAGGVRVTKLPMAYCKISSTGACRYPGQLATSLRLVPSLLKRQPQLFRLMCKWPARGQCASTPSAARDSFWHQSNEDWERDPHYCKLQLSGLGTCSSGSSSGSRAPYITRGRCEPWCGRHNDSDGWHTRCTSPKWVSYGSCTGCVECRQLNRCCGARNGSARLALWVQDGSRWCWQSGLHRLQSVEVVAPDGGKGTTCSYLGCGYRIADAVLGKYNLLDVYARSLPQSLAGRYALRHRPGVRGGHPNVTLLCQLLADVPMKDPPVVASMHVRVEDVIDQFNAVQNARLSAYDFLCAPRVHDLWRLSALNGIPERWAKYVRTLEFYQLAADALLARNISELHIFAGGSPSTEFLNTSISKEGRGSESCSYLRAIQSFLAQAGIDSIMHWRDMTWHYRAKNPQSTDIHDRAPATSTRASTPVGESAWQSADRDFAAMTRARYFIPTGGGLSRLAEKVVLTQGRGEVLHPQTSLSCS